MDLTNSNRKDRDYLLTQIVDPSVYIRKEYMSYEARTKSGRVVSGLMAEQDGVPVAGAFNLIGRDTLYGRNWGSDGAHRFLHFEACYYQAIEFAIERGLAPCIFTRISHRRRSIDLPASARTRGNAGAHGRSRAPELPWNGLWAYRGSGASGSRAYVSTGHSGSHGRGSRRSFRGDSIFR